MTRRRAILGTAALPLGAGLGSLILPESAGACHTYVSPIDGRTGCGANRRDGSGGTTSSAPASSPPPSQNQSGATPRPASGNTSLAGGQVYRDELCGFNQSRRSGQRARLSVGRAPDGRAAIEAVYRSGRNACGATTFLDLFSGNGVSRAAFEVDLWFPTAFREAPGKLFGVYGGGDAYGGNVAGRPGCSNPEGGWASRITHGRNNRVDIYSYHQNRNTSCRSGNKQFGRTFVSRQSLPLGRWVTFRHEIVMNTPGNSDGVVRLWMDGSRLLDIGGLMYQRDSARYGIKGWSLWNALGGSCNSSAFFPTSNFSVWYRDLRVYA